jgi:hypothetical protein
MFDTPKYLLFALILFGFIHAVGNVVETGIIASAPGLDTGIASTTLNFAGVVKNIMFFDYSWLESVWFLKYILATFQWVFIALAARDFARFFRGVG